MTVIELDASAWNSGLDPYEALLAGLGAPDWHGRNLNAMIDSMIYGGINAVEPPFRVEITGLATAAPEAAEELRAIVEALAEHGAQCACSETGASIEITWPLSTGSLQTH